MRKVMPSPFKLAKIRTIPEIAADLARLKAEVSDLKRTRKQNKSAHGVRSALWIARAQMSQVKREKGVPKRAGMRRTMKKQRGCRRRRS
jgi:hypothetical protein